MHLSEPEDRKQIERIAAEYVRVGDVNAIVVDDKVFGLRQSAATGRPEFRDHAAKYRRGRGLALLQLGAEDGGEIADVLCHQEVVLHEALDVFHARVFGVAEPHGDLALDIEGESFLGAPGDEMDVAAHRPEEILAPAEDRELLAVEYALFEQFIRLCAPDRRIWPSKIACAGRASRPCRP